MKELLYTVNVTFAVAVPEDQDAQSYLADAINETLRDHMRHLAPQSCILDYIINGYRHENSVSVECYEEGDAFQPEHSSQNTTINPNLIAAAPELMDLVLQAHERFTDNDMLPPNHKLSQWLKKAESLFAKVGGY